MIGDIKYSAVNGNPDGNNGTGLASPSSPSSSSSSSSSSSTHRTYSASTRYVPTYVRRMFNFSQCDFEMALWSMIYLIFDSRKVYEMIKYHKQTRNMWGKDDPAALMILMAFILVASAAWGICFNSSGIFDFVKLLLYTVFVDLLLLGCITATVTWWLSNKYLRVAPSLHSVEQKVEWMFAFDVHCNSFFTAFIVLYVFQYILLPLLMMDNFFSTLMANSVYYGAFSWYYYNTYVGFSVLPFIQNANYFLSPIAPLGIVYLMWNLININATLLVLQFYFG